MRKFAIIVLLLLIGAAGFSQGNLQFNQVILLDIAPLGVTNVTVPAGKVWKIESVSQGNSLSPSVVLRNSTPTNIAYFTSSAGTVYPFWLPTSFIGSFQNQSTSYRASISILEFNIVP